MNTVTKKPENSETTIICLQHDDMTEKNTPIQINMLMNVLLTLSSIVFPLITLPYVTRVLGPENLGKVYFATSAVTFFAVFAELGIPVYGIRACARVRDDRRELTRTAHEIMTINLISCLTVYAVLAICMFTVPRFTEDRALLAVISSSMILNALGAEWIYKALEKYTYITIRSLIMKVLALIAIFILVRGRSDYVIYGFLTIAAAAASNIVNMTGIHRYIDIGYKGRMDLRRHLPGMLALLSLAAAATIYTNLDIAILDFMKGDMEAGFYGTAVKIKLVLVNLVTSVSAVLLPRTSFLAVKGDYDRFITLLKRTMSGVIALSVPAASFFIMFADDCISVLAGEEFSAAVLPMRIIMPSIIFIGISNITGMQMLVPAGKEKEVSHAAWIGAAVDLSLNMLFIPRFASAGAAASTLAAEIIVMIYLLRQGGRYSREIISAKSVLIVAAVSAAAIPACIWVRVTGLGGLAEVMTAALFYFGSYCLMIFVLMRKNVLLR